jgi:type IV pilus assembly protein PilA
MEFINRMRKNKKGFTLVEIIVVLVILAILAAFTIPTMLGFVGDSKKKAAIAEQREIYVAAQAIATEHFGKDGATNAKTNLGFAAAADADGNFVAANLGSAAVSAAAPTPVATEMKNYLGTDITAGDGTGAAALWTVTVSPAGKVTKVTYKKDGTVLDDLVPNANTN